jgi:hypothetical protein
LRPEDQARREFLTKTGRFAAVTAPAITLLLGTSLSSRAIAHSAGTKPRKWGGRFGGKKHADNGPNKYSKGPNKHARGPSQHSKGSNKYAKGPKD